jgi:molybdate transport system substrate-binding protein
MSAESVTKTGTERKALHLLCAGAAQGVIRALQPVFEADSGCRLEARFGAVGAMLEALRSGAPCDVFLATETMVEQLVASAELRAPRASGSLGRVRTGVAVRADDLPPAIETAAALRAALLAADRIYFPDAERSTAGIHFASVMKRLGVLEELAPRFATFPNGATAMRELAASTAAQPIGCTQMTEIRYTEGVRLVGALPSEFELATVYTAAVSDGSQEPELGQRFVDLLIGDASLELRLAGGFELEPHSS